MRLHIAAICLGLTAAALFAQAPAAPANAWQTSETLGSIDLSGLSAAQKNAVLKMVREQDCSCLCGMKVAECLVKDPNCSYSKRLAAIAVQGVKDGKSLVEISKLMDSSPKAHRPKLLEDPVSIPVDGSPIKGPADARITIIEFSDFECPYCSLAVKEVYTMMAAYPKDMKLIFKQFPLSMHPNAPLAAAASLAAKEQGKFWELHDLMFANFRRINRDNIMIWAKQAGLDMERFKNDLASTKYQPVIQKDVTDGEAVGVYGTPAFFINGKHYNGAVNMEALKPILDAELKGGAKSATRTN